MKDARSRHLDLCHVNVVTGLAERRIVVRFQAPNLQPTATQERDDQCGKQHYIRELLMMGIVVPRNMLSL